MGRDSDMHSQIGDTRAIEDPDRLGTKKKLPNQALWRLKISQSSRETMLSTNEYMDILYITYTFY